LAIIPFINLLYKLKFQRALSKRPGKLTPIFDQFHGKKVGTPVGGGLLVIMIVSGLVGLILPIFSVMGIEVTSVYANYQKEVNVLFFTFLSFGVLGLYDDIKKFFGFSKEKFFGLRMHQKLIFAVDLAMLQRQCFTLIWEFHRECPRAHLSWVGASYHLWFVILAFANAVNITDGLDGLASGTLMISLFALVLSSTILDVPLSLFLVLWIVFNLILYFNVYPARLFMAMLAPWLLELHCSSWLTLRQDCGVLIIGFIFVFEISTSLIQLLSKKFLHKKIMPAAPFHLTLQKIGWEEPKIVQRVWLMQIMLTLFGVWLE
jgi:phospho-N-acetylmuramoyl-pentapeptide-transferase